MPAYSESNHWRQGFRGAANGWENTTTGYRVDCSPNDLFNPVDLIKVFRPMPNGQPAHGGQADDLLVRSGNEALTFETAEQARAYADGHAACADRLAAELEQLIPNLRRRHTPQTDRFRQQQQNLTALIERLGQPVPGHRYEFVRQSEGGETRRSVLKVVQNLNTRISVDERILENVDFVAVAHTEDDITFDVWEVQKSTFVEMSTYRPGAGIRPSRYECRFEVIRPNGAHLPAIDLNEPLHNAEAG